MWNNQAATVKVQQQWSWCNTRVDEFSNSLVSLRIKQFENDSMLQFALSAGVRGNFQQPKLHCFASTLISKLQVAASHTLQTSYQYCTPLGNDNKYWTHETKSSHILDPPARLILKPGEKRERRTRSTDLLCRVVSDTIFSCSRTLCSSSQINSMELQQVVDVLKNMAAPSLAGQWRVKLLRF